MRYHIGDELVLKVKELFGYRDIIYRAEKVRIIGFNVDCDGPDAEYVVYVPPYSHLRESFVLTTTQCRLYDIDNRFIGDDVAFISARHPLYKHIPAPQGETCDHCNEFFEGASRANEEAYMCRACTQDPWR